MEINFSICNLPTGDARHTIRDPILLLQGSQSTLKSLRAAASVSSPYGPRYPNLTSLSLWYVDLPAIEHYIRAFPNLLSFTTFECSQFRLRPWAQVWEDHRAMSMLHQAQHGTWRCLRHYTGSVVELWTFGLACQIHTVEMNFPRRASPRMLNDVLLAVRPSVLALMLPGASCLLDEALCSVLSEAGRLRELTLQVLLNLHENDETTSLGDVLVSLVVGAAFSFANTLLNSKLRLPLQDLLVDVVRASFVPTFSLDLTWKKAVPSRREESNGEEVAPVMPFEIYLQHMDVDAYTDALLEKVASLKEVQVSVVRPGEEFTRQVSRKRTEH